jgi:calcium/calmodulin-dependent protein kinase I
LGRLKKSVSYSEKYVAQVMLRLFGSLQYIHSKGILHRDIKPENLILHSRENNYDICLADFGLADFYNTNCDYIFRRCGTPGYVAPELL